MRTLLRWLAGVGAVAVLALACFAIPTLFGKPWSLDHYTLRELVSFAIRHPMLLSYARVLEPLGLDFHSDELEDVSFAARLADQRRVSRALEGLREFQDDELTENERLSYEVLEWFLETLEAREPFLFHDYPLNQFDGWQSFLADFMIDVHQINDVDDADDYIARLRQFGPLLDQLVVEVAAREERGVVPPKFVLEAVGDEIAGFRAATARENPLFIQLEERLAALDGVSDARRANLLGSAADAMNVVVLPGYERLQNAVADLATRATTDDGVWKLPDGDAYYRWALRFHTSTDLDPDEVHRIGLAEVERIHGEMRDVLRAEGLPSEDPIATIQALNRDPRFQFSDDDQGRAEILAGYQAIIDEVTPSLQDLFGVLPRAPVAVERVPVFKEAGAAGAYYRPPPLDGSRPGTFFANLRDVSEVQRFGMRTLAFHEAIPGHHLQIALSLENRDLPLFRRFIPFTAFTEGWALYAERLATESGFHPTGFDVLGALVAENFRAVRLVVDTGIHAKRWSRERAIEFMLRNTGSPEGDVVAEIERYIVMPGQACAYKIGQLRLLELRDRARASLGERFDLRAFHDFVLGGGALPLDILEREVDGWIAGKRG